MKFMSGASNIGYPIAGRIMTMKYHFYGRISPRARTSRRSRRALLSSLDAPVIPARGGTANRSYRGRARCRQGPLVAEWVWGESAASGRNTRLRAATERRLSAVRVGESGPDRFTRATSSGPVEFGPSGSAAESD